MNALTHAALDLSQSDTLVINHFIFEFLKWTLPSLNLNMSTDANRGFNLKSKKKKKKKKEKIMANSVGHNETVPRESSHLDLHCLHSYLWFAGL